VLEQNEETRVFYIRDTGRGDDGITVWPAELADEVVPDGYYAARDHRATLGEGHYIGLSETNQWYVIDGVNYGYIDIIN
jgi:hypothetical protein